MAIFRSFSEIVNSIKERLKLTQPNLDTKPGTVARDLFIDVQADQIERLHSSLLLVSQKQSPDLAVGKDLDKWARNFGMSRRSGAPSGGIVVFTVNNISSDIPIPSGTVCTSRSGLQYRTMGNFVISIVERNKFAAIASRLRGGLNVAGITDSFAIEVPVQATRSGTVGDISTLQIIEHNLEDSMNITNLTAFRGGSNLESDAAFRSRIFAVFSGANTGTASGYRNASLSVTGVRDAVIIEPGNTLMLRDGTETIEVNDGSFRILDSGTGGKVDIYILGSQLIEVVESLIYTDLSGSGNATDERNDIIPGLLGLDNTLTSEERRVLAFKTGELPLQPISLVVSLIGSASGILAEKSTDSSGKVSGSFELIKDVNVETGGSPFGFDKIRFISSVKEVDAESIIKKDHNSVDPFRFTDIKELGKVYQDVQVTGENSKVSSAEKNVIKINHSPIVNVSRVVNKTTGEVYVVVSQGLDSETGLNNTGEIIISGKTLPSASDILSSDYTWRHIFDDYIEYNGKEIVGLIKDESVADSIDWGTSNGIFKEESVIDRTSDGFEYQVTTLYNTSRVLSVYSARTVDSTVSNVVTIENAVVPGIVISSSEEAIENVISVRNSDGLELFATPNNDGSPSGREIILPTDSPAVNNEAVTVFYNKIELFNIENGDGSFDDNIITLPSDDILEGEELFEIVDDLYLTGEAIFVEYIANIIDIIPSQSLSLTPINGADTSNILSDGTLLEITGSNQPIFYEYDEFNSKIDINRFGPTRISITTAGTIKPGKIKVTGTTLSRMDLDITAGISINGKTFNLNADIRSALGLSSLPTNMGIARVDSVASLDNPEKIYDILGQEINNIEFAFKTAKLNSSLNNTEFVLPSTVTNNLISISSGERVRISFLLYRTGDFEDLYFPGNNNVITNRMFGRIDRVSVSSGFRSTSGALVGTISAVSLGQPKTGLTYSTSYNFAAPKEGERLTVRYNLNRLIGDVTVGVEKVRSITADVLVKEAPILNIDVSGEVVINSDAETNSKTVIENASNAVVNLINSSILGSTIDYSDILSAVTSVTGVDSANISLFNESGKTGRRTFIKSLDNQNLASGSINFTSISRQDFRIT